MGPWKAVGIEEEAPIGIETEENPIERLRKA